MCCTGVFIVETMLRVVINDEIKQLVLPSNLTDRIWNRKRSPFYEGGVEKLVPFNYPALVSRLTEAVIFNIPRDEEGHPVRSPALTKLRVGNIDPIMAGARGGHNRTVLSRIIKFDRIPNIFGF